MVGDERDGEGMRGDGLRAAEGRECKGMIGVRG